MEVFFEYMAAVFGIYGTFSIFFVEYYCIAQSDYYEIGREWRITSNKKQITKKMFRVKFLFVPLNVQKINRQVHLNFMLRFANPAKNL